MAVDVQPHHGAFYGLPEADIDLIFKISAGLRTGLLSAETPARTSTAKDAGEDVTETATAPSRRPAFCFGKIETAEVKGHTLCSSARRSGAKTTRAETAAPRVSFCRGGVDIVRVVADLVEYLSLLGLAENIIRFRDLLELLFGLFVSGIYVRMKFTRKFPERLADLFRSGGLFDAKCGVVIFGRGGHLYLGSFAFTSGILVACHATTCHFPLRFRNVPVLRNLLSGWPGVCCTNWKFRMAVVPY